MSTLPTYDQVLQLPQTQRRTVPADYIDENNHMNIGRYLELAAAAVWTATTDLGMGQGYIDERRMTTFTVEHHLRYLSELRLGDDLSVHVRLLERSAKALHSMAFIVDRTRERLAFTFEDVAVHVGMDSRRPEDFPADIAERLDRAIDEGLRHGWDAPVTGVMGVRRR